MLTKNTQKITRTASRATSAGQTKLCLGPRAQHRMNRTRAVAMATVVIFTLLARTHHAVPGSPVTAEPRGESP